MYKKLLTVFFVRTLKFKFFYYLRQLSDKHKVFPRELVFMIQTN